MLAQVASRWPFRAVASVRMCSIGTDTLCGTLQVDYCVCVFVYGRGGWGVHACASLGKRACACAFVCMWGEGGRQMQFLLTFSGTSQQVAFCREDKPQPRA